PRPGEACRELDDVAKRFSGLRLPMCGNTEAESNGSQNHSEMGSTKDLAEGHGSDATAELDEDHRVGRTKILTCICPAAHRGLRRRKRVMLEASHPGDLMTLSSIHDVRDSDSHRLLDQVCELAPAGLALLDRDLCCVRANARLADMMGIPAVA